MSGSTNRVPLSEAADLLTGTARGSIGFVDGGTPTAVPARVLQTDGRLLVGVAATVDVASLDELVAVADAGHWFFDLRAVYARGRPDLSTFAVQDDMVWFELIPERLTAWDYGRLRADDGVG